MTNFQQCSYTKIHFVRHAQTTDNRDDKISGNGSDPSLTEAGIEQAELRGQNLLPFKENISYIVSSNMTRTNQTTEIINKHLGLPIRLDSSFQEKYFGELEGKPVEFLKNLYIEAEKQGIKDVVAVHGGESIEEFNNRIKDATCEMFQSSEEEIIIVAHGHLLRKLTEMFYNKTHFFSNAEHIFYNPAEIENLQEICGFNECIIDNFS